MLDHTAALAVANVHLARPVGFILRAGRHHRRLLRGDRDHHLEQE